MKEHLSKKRRRQILDDLEDSRTRYDSFIKSMKFLQVFLFAASILMILLCIGYLTF